MSDFDPTTNRILYGLMTLDEKRALANWPHGWEFYSDRDDTWKDIEKPSWATDCAYRGKPAPVVTSAWWNVDRSGRIIPVYFSRKDADREASSNRIAVLRMDTCNGVSTAHLEDI